MNFAVVCTYHLDDDVAVYLFTEEAEAKNFLMTTYQESLANYAGEDDIDDTGAEVVGEVLNDYHAVIRGEFDDDPENYMEIYLIAEFRIGKVYE